MSDQRSVCNRKRTIKVDNKYTNQALQFENVYMTGNDLLIKLNKYNKPGPK